MPFDNASTSQITSQAGFLIVLRAQEHRSMATIFNDPRNGGDVFYLILGTEQPSTTKATIPLYPGGYFELPKVLERGGEEHVYNGQIGGFWLNNGSLNGRLFVTDIYGSF